MESLKSYQRVDLMTFFNQTSENNQDRQFITFESFLKKNTKDSMFVLLDNKDKFTVIDRNLRFKSLIKTSVDPLVQRKVQHESVSTVKITSFQQ